jgi:hypothetical protein
VSLVGQITQVDNKVAVKALQLPNDFACKLSRLIAMSIAND